MKKRYASFLLLLFSIQLQFVQAQSEIWGLTTANSSGFGTMFSMPTGSTNMTFTYTFSGNSGSSPQHTKLLQAANGKLYGLTNTGGTSNTGVLFEYDITNNLYIKKVDFTGTNGASPRGALMEANNGKLYGMTSAGGTNGVGVIFEYDYVNNIYTKKVDLATASGSGPYGALMQAANGKLYGLTRSGGASSAGVIFEYDLNGTYTKKIDLSSTTGGVPFGALVAAPNGSLYALASNGGTANLGTVFEYDYVNNVCNKKVDLTLVNGSAPQGSMILATDGNLYGLTFGGGTSSQGTIFQYSVSSGTYTKLFNLSTATTGSFPSGDLVQASNGKFYGMARSGGASSGGTIFEYDLSGPTFTKKIDLANSTAIGGAPFGSMIQATNGKFYGLTSNGGITGGGVLYEYDVSGNSYTKKVDLNAALNGSSPNGSLIYANNNKLYGMTLNGGANNAGTIFEYDKSNATFTKKVDLSTANGSAPYGALIQAPNGKLYGMTNAGGANGVGVIFEYDLNGTYTKKVDLSTTNGCSPFGSLVLGSNGKLYGLTRVGGSSNLGVIFEYDYVNNIYTKKLDFVNTNGANPNGSMVNASNGKLYGLTQVGGVNFVGVLFEYDYINNVYTKKVDLAGANGSQPYGGLVEASNGKLYGTTRLGGSNNAGVVFEYDYVNNTYSKTIDLSTTNGSQPFGSMIKAANGKLYGMTQSGGANSLGVVFEYDVTGVSYTKLLDFNGGNGSTPGYGNLMEICSSPTVAGSISLSNSSICETSASIQTFSVASVAGATSYTWTLPSGASVTGGNNTNNLSVNLSGVSAGIYTLTVGGLNVCGTGSLSTSNITVNVNPVLSVNSGSICGGSSFTINPNGASTYTYSGGSAIVTPTGNTNYTVTGTNSLGCVSSAVVSTVTVSPAPVISVSGGSICSGNSFTLNPTGGISYTNTSGSLVVSPTVSTTYSVNGTDNAGCVSTSPGVVTITVATLPVISVASGSICNGSSFTLSPTGASSYTYSGGSAIVSPTSTSNYSVTGTSSLGCISAFAGVATVSVVALPVINVNNGTICVGNSFTINPTGASSYTFSGGSAIVSPTVSTTYSVTGTSAAGCVSSGPALSAVTVNTLPVISVNSGSICNGQLFTMIPTGGVSYTYTGGSATVSPTITTNYSVSGTNANGCVSASPAISTVSVVALPVISVNSGSICNGNSFTLVPNGASTYTYSGGSSIVSPTITSNYSVTGTSSVGCVSSVAAVANVTVIARPTVSVTSGAICFGNVYTMIPSGASTYTFSNGSATVSPSSTSSYSVVGTSALGCVSSNTAVSLVTVNALPIIGVNSGTICFGNVFTMNPTGAITYTYSNGSSTVSPSSNTSYSVMGTDNNGCVSASPAVSTVSVFALPVIGVNSGSICNGGSFTLNPNGAATYTFSGGSSIVSPGTTTNYSVTGSSAVGCISATPAIATVTVIALPVISVNSGTICFGNTFTLNPTGAASYTFSSGSAQVSPTITSSFSVTGTSSVGCLSSNTAVSTVTVFALPVISVNSGTICSGKTFTMVPGGANSYTYTGGSPVVGPTVTTSYSVTGTSTAGCISPVPAVSTVTVYALPTVALNSGTLCIGKTYTLNATLSPSSSPVTYTYSSGSPLVSPTITSSYSVVATNSLGCVSSNTAVATVSVIALPTISPISGSICAGNSYTMTSTGAVSYTYSSPSNVVTPSITSTYSVIGTSSLGCASVIPALLTVTVNPLPPVVISGTNGVCSGSSLTLTASGANTYIWGSTTGSVLVVSPASSTSYSVLGTSANGCSSLTSIFVSVYPNPTVTSNSGFICPGDAFTITPSGAVTYSYSGGSNVVSPTVTTSYSVTGTNSLGCVSLQPAVSTVSVVNILTVSITGNTTVCAGESVTLTANGANTYSWNTNATTASIIETPTVSGSYTVVGSSGNCSDTTSVLVTVNPLPVLSATSSSTRICVNESTTLSVSGAASYTWNTNPPSTNPILVLSPTITTVYQVTGIDLNGCMNTTSITQTVDLCTGLSAEGMLQQSVKLYPNPNNGQFVIELNGLSGVTISNSLGQLIKREQYAEGAHTLSLNEFPKGIYLVTITQGGHSVNYKVITQ